MSANRIGVVLEERFKRLPDGRVFSPNGFGADFWIRYRSAFGDVRIIARVEPCSDADSSWAEVPDGHGALNPIHPFVGPLGFLRSLPSVLKSFNVAIRDLDGLVVRSPGMLSAIAERRLKRRDLAFAVELVGDPIDVFGSGIAGRLGPVLQWMFARNTRWLCANAAAVSYVTRETLQRRYPHAPNAATISCSSVQLQPQHFASGPREATQAMPRTMMCAASLEVPYKGIDVLIDALALIDGADRPRTLIAGDGRLRAELQARADRLGVAKSVVFLGRLDKDAVATLMGTCDLYVQPSLTEGLPRAIVEAMAAGSPVIGTSVGGIPELLDPTELVPPGDPSLLARLIAAVLSDPDRRMALSRRNLAMSRDFAAEILDSRRRQFYETFDNHCTQRRAAQ